MRYLHFLAAGLLLPSIATAQNELDALRFSQVSSAATARSLSLGGAGGSIGGDFSSLSINPAGLGVYRNSEIMFTPTLRINSMKGDYLGSSSTDNNTKMNLNNFGVVFTTAAKGEKYNRSDWKAFSVGLGYNRVADFNSRGYYAGNNTQSSMTEGMIADGLYNGYADDLAPPFGFLSYYGYLDNADGQSIAYQNIIKKGGSLNQAKSWESKGGINEWNLSLGGNYREKLLLGAAISLTSYKYDRSTNYYEEDASLVQNDFDYMSYNEIISTTGIGVNLKVGAIYIVNDVLRLGASIHTPTWSAFSDISDYNITTNTEGYKASLGGTGSDANPESFVQPANQFSFDYSLRTPWRGVLSATAFMGKYGFVTADYEYAGYNSMRYSMPDARDYQNTVNNAIKDTYKGTHNVRLGVEGRLQNFMGRLGFAYYSSPFRQADMFKGQRMDLSAGLGARFGGFFVDLAYVYMTRRNGEFAYPVLVAPDASRGIRSIPVGIADITSNTSLIALTMGFKF